MKTLQSKIIVMLSLMLAITLVLASLLVNDALHQRRQAAHYGRMERVAGHLNAAAGWQAIERAIGAIILGNANSPAALLEKYDELGKTADNEAQQAADEMAQIVAFDADNADLKNKLNDWTTAWKTVQQSRSPVKTGRIPVTDWIKIATKNIEAAFALRAAVFSPHGPREQVFFYNSVVRANVATLCEYAGRERAALAARIAAKEAIPPEQRETLKAWRALVDNNIEQVLALKTAPTTPAMLVAAIAAFEKVFLDDYQRLREQVYAASTNAKPYPVDASEWVTRSTQAINTGLAISNSIGKLSAEAVDTINATASNTMLLNSALMGIAITVFALVILFIRRFMIRPIANLVTVMNAIANGDLTTDIPDQTRQDEIGLLAKAAGIMQQHLHTLTTMIRAEATAVHAAAQQMAGTVEEQAATTSEMSASVAEITSTMEELSVSSTQIAEHARSVVDIATATWENSKKGADAMQSVLGKMGDIRNDNQLSLKEIIELGSRSKEISKIMEIINTVADQTKLIAFNAALEASSAGEAGRRFGVVAAEIRRLADNVTESTNEIATKIAEIQDSISRLVITSEKGAVRIAEGMSATANTATHLGELVDAASQTSSAAQQISLSTQQQKTASNQVVMALREIATASTQTAQSINHIARTGQDMTAMSAELNALVDQFDLSKKT